MDSQLMHGAVPSLLVLGSVMSVPKPTVLGLGLLQRTALAARRAGYAGVFLLAPDQDAPADIRKISDWHGLADALASCGGALVIAPANILSETEWLEKLSATRIEPGAWAAINHVVIVLGAEALSDALSVLDSDGAARGLTAVEERLRARFGPPAVISLPVDPLIVMTSKDIRVAERRLLRSVVKTTDGFMARHVERPISLQISRCLAPTAIRPTQVTMISMIIGLCGAPFFLSPIWYWQTVGALLFLLHSIVDGCDGELARLKFQESRYGGILDFWADNVVHVAVFGSMAAGWASSSGAKWPLLLGAAAIFGTLGSAGFVYWRQMRGRDGSAPLFTSVSD